jgi:hypothetical protein
MPVINKSDNWDEEFERIHPELNAFRVKSIDELEGLGFTINSMQANDPSSATRPAGRHDCNRDAMAGFAAAHG